eukprot:6174890-Pleurochrysis_carterae.AAC.3
MIRCVHAAPRIYGYLQLKLFAVHSTFLRWGAAADAAAHLGFEAREVAHDKHEELGEEVVRGGDGDGARLGGAHAAAGAEDELRAQLNALAYFALNANRASDLQHSDTSAINAAGSKTSGLRRVMGREPGATQASRFNHRLESQAACVENKREVLNAACPR